MEIPSTTTMDPNSFQLAQISNKPENPSEDHSDHLLDVGQSNSEGEIQARIAYLMETYKLITHNPRWKEYPRHI